jgi:hypothetical protein
VATASDGATRIQRILPPAVNQIAVVDESTFIDVSVMNIIGYFKSNNQAQDPSPALFTDVLTMQWDDYYWDPVG